MTLLTNSFEGGTSGVSVSSVNSGGPSGNHFDSVIIGAGGTLAYSNAQSAHGSLSLLCQTVAANPTGVTWTGSMGNQNQVWFQSYMYFPSIPAGDTRWFTTSISGAGMVRFTVTPAGKLQIEGSVSTFIAGTNVVPTSQWFRVSGYATGSVTMGQAQVNLYSPMDALTPVESDTTAANLNTGGTFTSYSFGPVPGTANQGPFYMDDLWLSSDGPFIYPSSTIPTESFKWNQTVSRTASRLVRM